MRFDKDALKFLIPILILLVVIYAAKVNRAYNLIPLILGLFVIFFFRDPIRKIPGKGNPMLVSPVDGTVLYVDQQVESTFINDTTNHIAIFLSLFDVHINRSPISGKVMMKEVVSGGFAPANDIDRSDHNNGVLTGLETRFGKVLIIQRVGIIARRIVNRINVGDELNIGDKIGLMRFGSRMDIYFPLDWEIKIKKGDQVRAPETVLAIPPITTKVNTETTKPHNQKE
jgi:phosphatidylserine decarboxylase